jgi:hypothetical protein
VDPAALGRVFGDQFMLINFCKCLSRPAKVVLRLAN